MRVIEKPLERFSQSDRQWILDHHFKLGSLLDSIFLIIFLLFRKLLKI